MCSWTCSVMYKYGYHFHHLCMLWDIFDEFHLYAFDQFYLFCVFVVLGKFGAFGHVWTYYVILWWSSILHDHRSWMIIEYRWSWSIIDDHRALMIIDNHRSWVIIDHVITGSLGVLGILTDPQGKYRNMIYIYIKITTLVPFCIPYKNMLWLSFSVLGIPGGFTDLKWLGATFGFDIRNTPPVGNKFWSGIKFGVRRRNKPRAPKYPMLLTLSLHSAGVKGIRVGLE